VPLERQLGVIHPVIEVQRCTVHAKSAAERIAVRQHG
jgi:hypothetical protein